MQIKPKLPYIAILSTLALFGVTSFWPMNGWWGINHLAYLGMPFSYLFWIITLALLVLAVVPDNSSYERVIVRIDKFIWGDRYWTRLLIVCLAMLLFAVFRVKTHFLGDGYTWLAFFGQENMNLIKWTEPGSIFLVRTIQSLMGGFTRETAVSAFSLLSILSGGITIVCLMGIVKRLSDDPDHRLISLITLLCSGSILLFCGYVEVYAMVWATASLFLYLSLRYLQEGRGFGLTIAAFCLAVAMHFQVLFMVAGLLLLLLHHMGFKRLSETPKKSVLWLVIAMVVTVALIASWISSRVESLSILVPLVSSTDYTLFSEKHLLDVLNEVLLICPGVIVLGVMLIKCWRHKSADPTVWFLTLCSVGSILFLVLVDPKLGMARDWDLMSLTVLSPTLLLLYLIDKCKNAISLKTVVLFGMICLIPTAGYIAVNNNVSASEDRFESLINYYDLKDEAGWGLFAYYFLNNENYSKAEEIVLQMKERGIRAADVTYILGIINKNTGQLSEAEKNLRNAVAIKPYQARLKNELGQVLIKQGQYDEALSIFREARKQDRSLTVILESIGLVFIYQRHLDSASCMADTLFNGDPNSAGGHALAMVVAVNRGDIVIARTHFVAYRQFGENRSDYQRMCKHYSYLMDN